MAARSSSMVPFGVLLCCVLVNALVSKEPVAGNDEEYDLTIRLDDAVPQRHDDLICTGAKLDPEEVYIVRFTPHASKSVAHHLVVYGCYMPGSENYTQPWQCPGRDDTADGICSGGNRQILFAWANDAPPKSLPEGVGLRVSGRTGINYIVIQLHYAKKFEEGQTDDSGITLRITKQRTPQQVGYLVLLNTGYIPPQQPDYHLESSCNYTRNYTIYPIGYRTHAHNLGLVTSGYRIRNNEWTEIGRMSPQLPQMFYEVSNPGMDIRHGDVLASRCTMNSMARTEATYMGAENHDEMCNFYIMYSTYDQRVLRNEFCVKNAQQYHWTDEFDATIIPTDASSLEGIPNLEEVLAKFPPSGM